MSGSISREAFLAAAQRLGLSEGVELAFSFAQRVEGARGIPGTGSLLGNWLIQIGFSPWDKPDGH